MKGLVKGRETVRAEFPSIVGIVDGIKERQLESSVKWRNASFTSLALSACFPRSFRIPSLWREARSDAGVSQYSYICRPINEIWIALIIRDTFPSPRGRSSLRFTRLQGGEERAEGWERRLASVPPLSLVNFTSLGWVITAGITAVVCAAVGSFPSVLSLRFCALGMVAFMGGRLVR